MDNSIVLGVDIGGSHITAALVNLETKTLVQSSKVRENVDSKGSASEIMDRWIEVIEKAFSAAIPGQKIIGIAMPGPFDYANGISLMQQQDKYDALYLLSIREILAGRIKTSPSNIYFVNDAESFLKGEVFCGAAKGAAKAIGLTLGTGLGSATYQSGTVSDADLWRSPFKESIAEEYLSTRWFIKRFAELSGDTIKDVKALVDVNGLGDIKQQLFTEFGHNLALFLNSSMASIQPEIVVLGGNISNAYELFKNQLHAGLSSSFSAAAVQKTVLGEDACLIGAASACKLVAARAA